jgi:biotin operon repressor
MAKTYEDQLTRLAKVLARKQPHTARELASKLKCSKPTVYARLAALEASGTPIARLKVRDGTRGPLAAAFKT